MQRLPLLLLFFCACSSQAAPAETAEVSAMAPPTSGSEAPPAEAPEASAEPACTSSGLLSYVASADAYENRHGVRAVRFSDFSTSQDKPFEECGLGTVLQRLATLQCNDGTNPFLGNPSAAHASRRGSTGPGGRCGAIIDLYVASCPEAQYEIFADLYFCPAGRSPID